MSVNPRRVSGSGMSRISGDGFRPYQWQADPEEPEPREIVAELHAKIAALSPEHAVLVAKFEARHRGAEAS